MLILFSMLFLCGLLMQAAVVNAVVAGYVSNDYQTSTPHTIDGKWTTATEWTDGATAPNLVSGFLWRESWYWQDGTVIFQYFLIEAFTDNTNDTGDIVVQIYDCAANGGTAPQSDDVKIELVGNRLSGLSVYKGNGTGWAKTTFTATDANAAASISSSPLNSSPHLIVEIMVNKNTLADVSGAGYQPGVYVSAYDASNSAAGVKSWPPAPASSANVPNGWGTELGTTEAIPESFTVATVIALSSVAVFVGFYFLRKDRKLRVTTPKMGI